MTRKKILIVSSELFFENGIANVRLQQIADKANISVGNLAYHFKNKEAIVTSIYNQVFIEMYKLVENPFEQYDLSDLDRSIKAIYKFNYTYNFCYNNVWEISRNYPDIQEQWHAISHGILVQIQKRLTFYVKKGWVHSEPYSGAHKILSQQLLLNFFCWIPHQQVRGKTASLQAFKKSTWALVYPHLTSQGIADYNQLGVEK